MKKDYLPSEQFIARVIIIVATMVIIFGLYELTIFIKNKIGVGNGNILVRDLVVKDSNTNGIPDWEETLWGLDPNQNGPSNKVFIDEKKKTLRENGAVSNDINLTENDKIARELFVLITTLQQTGNLNADTENKISEAIGQKVIATPIPDVYVKGMLSIVPTNPTSIKKYYDSFKKLGLKYSNKDIGLELTFISQAVEHNDQQALYAALTVAKAYRSFGQELMKIPVPTSLANTQLDLANNYEKTAKTIEEMQNLLVDQLTGMRAVVNYKKYNDALILNLENMRSFFTKNGILE